MRLASACACTQQRVKLASEVCNTTANEVCNTTASEVSE